jgi:hypothetical protein
VVATRSKARPARLIYPREDREEREEVLGIALVTVDADGGVSGVKLQRTPSPRVVDRAVSGLFRFVYDPARDDAGRPIKSTVIQRFMIE